MTIIPSPAPVIVANLLMILLLIPFLDSDLTVEKDNTNKNVRSLAAEGCFAGFLLTPLRSQTLTYDYEAMNTVMLEKVATVPRTQWNWILDSFKKTFMSPKRKNNKPRFSCNISITYYEYI